MVATLEDMCKKIVFENFNLENLEKINIPKHLKKEIMQYKFKYLLSKSFYRKIYPNIKINNIIHILTCIQFIELYIYNLIEYISIDLTLYHQFDI